MSAEIYYFSGTGNCLTVAKDIADRTGAVLIPIVSLTENTKIKTNADFIGIVFPVYYGEPPMIVEEFARKLHGIQHKYIFAVCTFGGAAASSLRMLKRTIRSNGGELSAAYGVHMPQNSFYKPKEDRQKIFRAWEAKLDVIVKNTNRRRKGVFYSNALLELLLIPIHAVIIKPICEKHFRKISQLPKAMSYDAHKHAMDRNFSTNERCGGCGICEKICPVANIRLEDGKPAWQNRCEHCLACYNWCPNHAIHGGITSKDFFYRHPAVKIHEIMDQKRRSFGNEST